VRYEHAKFSKKVMIFDGISKRWRTLLVTISGAIDAVADCDDCINSTRLIPGMIEADGGD
jgi:hypothetical protein